MWGRSFLEKFVNLDSMEYSNDDSDFIDEVSESLENYTVSKDFVSLEA